MKDAIINYMTIKEVPENYQLITDSQDIESIIEMIGFTNENISKYTTFEKISDIGLLFIDDYEGEIWKVLAHSQNISYLHYELELIFDRSKK